MFVLDIIRFNGSSLSQFMRPYFNNNETPSFSVVSNPSFSAMPYGMPKASFTTMFFFLLQDPFPDRMAGSIAPEELNHITTGLSLSQAVYYSSFTTLTRSPSSLFSQSTLDSTVPVIGTHTLHHVGNVFAAEVSQTDMAEFTAVLTDPLFIQQHALHQTINFKHPSYRWLESWYAERSGYIGVEEDVRRRVQSRSYMRSVRTCQAAMHIAFGKEFPPNATVSFWREIFEYHEVTTEHNELWALFLSNKKLNYFMSIEDIAEMETYFTSLSESPLVIAIPVVEIVTCSFDVTKQSFWNNDVMQSRFVRQDENGVMLLNAALNEIEFKEDRSVFRCGDVGISIGMSNDFLSDTMRSHSAKVSNQQHAKHPTSRRLLDTYGESLVYTSVQLTRKFGHISAAVPAHMPHLINKSIMRDIESELSQFVNNTIMHRFRENTDLQYAFLYFHYMEEVEKVKRMDHLAVIWKEHLDTDGNGVLDSNELETLATIVYKDTTEE